LHERWRQAELELINDPEVELILRRRFPRIGRLLFSFVVLVEEICGFAKIGAAADILQEYIIDFAFPSSSEKESPIIFDVIVSLLTIFLVAPWLPVCVLVSVGMAVVKIMVRQILWLCRHTGIGGPLFHHLVPENQPASVSIRSIPKIPILGSLLHTVKVCFRSCPTTTEPPLAV
jgi:hypothetical protein